MVRVLLSRFIALFRSCGIFVALILGYLFPQFHIFQGWIQWLTMCLLFMTFLNVDVRSLVLRKSHVVVYVFNLVVAYVFWGVFYALGYFDLAVMAFFIVITPTASASPVVVGFLRGNVGFAVTGLVFSSLVTGALMPVMIPPILGHDVPGLTGKIFGSLCWVLFLPFVGACVLRRVYPRVCEWPRRYADLQFLLWNMTLFLTAAEGAYFVKMRSGLSSMVFLWAFLLAAVICVVCFSLGYWVAPQGLRRECSQMMGQKNTSITIVIALMYATPLVALSVMFYMVCHNVWNAIQIEREMRKEQKSRRLAKLALREEEGGLFMGRCHLDVGVKSEGEGENHEEDFERESEGGAF